MATVECHWIPPILEVSSGYHGYKHLFVSCCETSDWTQHISLQTSFRLVFCLLPLLFTMCCFSFLIMSKAEKKNHISHLWRQKLFFECAAIMMDDISSLLLCSRDVLMLSFYDIIHAVEPVDAWKPEVNLYESGEIACTALQTSRFASKSSALTVSTNQTEVTQGKRHLCFCSGCNCRPSESKVKWHGFLEGKISSCLA